MVNEFSESALVVYFAQKVKILNSASLWSKYSMLKAALAVKNNVNINTYPKLKGFLKKQSVGYKPKKAQVFSKHEVTKFISETPDEKFLVMKVTFLIGFSEACRREELKKKMAIEDIENKGSFLIDKIPDA
ncbi:hypothetical protein BDFB_010154 [Asbolus verrucosus]|uniref:Uncharacterized protein n=1 Tax=Asbolus verrucosus TaxID=1661398 RepID=A0A482WD95_ASBVE|nr:hypothetical protein BDFB_010154 [Asbolus verrucosus]